VTGSDRVHRIAVIPGDGIGPEVVNQALKVLDVLEHRLGFTTERAHFDLGGAHYLATGETLTEETLLRLGCHDALLLGAIGHPEVPPSVLERGLLLMLRSRFDLYANVRPIRLREGIRPVLKGVDADQIDFVVVRENTESLYVGAGGVSHRGTAGEVATQESHNTRFAVERIVRHAFELAELRLRRLTLVHKTNVLSYAGDLWARVVDEVGRDFPRVRTDYAHVDAACLYLVTDPGRFDVVVTDNLFGDIISDLGAGIQGGIGLAASGNLDPTRRSPSMFEPIHGSAPDIAGQNVADPTAAIVSMGMLLDFLGENQAHRWVESAVGAHLAGRGEALLSTVEVGDRIADLVRSIDETPPSIG